MGIRGVPAAHGGFETFATRLAPYMVERGWDVTVYCQEEDRDHAPETHWGGGVRRVHIGIGPDTPGNSIRFDWACIAHAVRERPDVVLTLGYNTAIFNARLRLAGVRSVINMDGVEWARRKWGPLAKAWLYLNDRAGCLIAHHLVADHPEINRLLRGRVRARKITTIAYGTDLLRDVSDEPLARYGLRPGAYATLIARPEPENSVLEAVRAWSRRRRGVPLVVLGHYVPERVRYHAAVMGAASQEVRFVGALYDHDTVRALRYHAMLYIHGHRVGGTNPSLLEAMGAGNPLLAHDNRFNRHVAADAARYFRDADEADAALSDLLADADARAELSARSRRRAAEAYHWPDILARYEATLAAACPRPHPVTTRPLPQDLDLDLDLDYDHLR